MPTCNLGLTRSLIYNRGFSKLIWQPVSLAECLTDSSFGMNTEFTKDTNFSIVYPKFGITLFLKSALILKLE